SGKDLLIHLAIPLGFYVYLIPFIASPVSEKIYVYEHNGVGHELFMLIRGVWIPISGTLYIVLSLFALRRHQRRIVNQFSSIDNINLKWLQYLIIWLAVIWVF